MIWSDWHNHDHSGFPGSILKPGIVVECEMVDCLKKPKGKMMFTVGKTEVTFESDSFISSDDPRNDGFWSCPSFIRCFANQACCPGVARYRYGKPSATQAVWSVREAE